MKEIFVICRIEIVYGQPWYSFIPVKNSDTDHVLEFNTYENAKEYIKSIKGYDLYQIQKFIENNTPY